MLQLRLLLLCHVLSALQLVRAVDVYLFPSSISFTSSQLSPEDASSALSHHLGLEIYESVRDSFKPVYEQANFVAQGQKHALLITLEEAEAEGILPSSLRPSFRLATSPSMPIDSLHSVVSTYLHRARHSYSSIYESLLSGWDMSEIRSMNSYIESSDDPVFAALDLSSLSRLRETHGPDSKEYRSALSELRNFLGAVINDQELKVAILTYSSTPSTSSYSKRQVSQAPFPSHAPPQQPIGSISTCFTNADSCKNATSNCSGRGQCLEATKSGRTCFVCACAATKSGEGKKVKTTRWVGESCERKDISSSFVLFAGTAIVIIVLAIGSVSLLYKVGEQSLPPTLTGTAVNAKKD